MKKLFVFAMLFSSLATSTVGADDYDRRIEFVNLRSESIFHVYGSPSSSNSWGSDYLGSQVIPSGESAIIDFDDGTGACFFDIKVVLKGGGERYKRVFNVCENERLIVR